MFRIVTRVISQNSRRQSPLAWIELLSVQAGSKPLIPGFRNAATAAAAGSRKDDQSNYARPDAQMMKSIPVEFTMIRENSKEFLDVANIDINLDDVKIDLGNHGSFILNTTHLRDLCFCPICMHPSSKQKVFIAKDFSKSNSVIKSTSFRPADETLLVEWTDGHESEYSLERLRILKPYLEGPTRNWNLRESFHFPQDDFYNPLDGAVEDAYHWKAEEIMDKLPVVDYEHLINREVLKIGTSSVFNANKMKRSLDEKSWTALSNLASSMVKYGLAKIVNVPQREFEVVNVARSIAYERPTGYGTLFDVVVEPSDDINLAYTADEFDLHTDLPYREFMPGVQLLHCIVNSSTGGLSYFTDGWAAAKQLQADYPNLFNVLSRFPTTFSSRDPYRDVRFRRRHPLISVNFEGKIDAVHYNPFRLPPVGSARDVKLYYLALHKFTQYMMDNKLKVITKMSAGDLFMFHNRRVLHGRSAYDATTSRRHLQGCYMDWDEVSTLHETLNKGQPKLMK